MTPPIFAPDLAPPGVEVQFVPWWSERPGIFPRSWFSHTNAARGEGSIQAAWNWAHRSRSNTLPTYIVDRQGDARKMLPSNRRAILTSTVTSSNNQWSSLTPGQRAEITAHGNVRDWSIGAETTDTGTDNDPTISAFTDAQAETLAEIIAYESIVWGFPLRFLTRWYGSGVASHTDPDGWPYTTLARGKGCPGDKKKAQMRAEVLPYAIEVAAAWTTPPTSPSEDYMIPTVVKTLDGPHLVQFSFRGPVYTMGQDGHDVSTAEVFGRGGGRAYVLGTGRIASYSTANPGSWAAEKAVMTEAQARARLRG